MMRRYGIRWIRSSWDWDSWKRSWRFWRGMGLVLRKLRAEKILSLNYNHRYFRCRWMSGNGKYDRLRRMMDGDDWGEEEEVRPKPGKSIRLPDDTDLESQRYPPLSPVPCPHHENTDIADQLYSLLRGHARQSVSPNQILINHPHLVLQTTTLPPKFS